MTNSSVKDIKRAQKESLLYREISKLFMRILMDDKRLEGLTINRVKLSADKSVCNVLFWTPDGIKEFKEKLPILILYKPSIRNALGKTIQSRYVPQIKFKFDDQFEKQQEVEHLLESLKKETKSNQ